MIKQSKESMERNPEEMRRCASEALELAAALEDRKGAAVAQQLLGIYYVRHEAYPEAIGYFFDALEGFEAVGYERGIRTSMHNLAGIYYATGQYEEALEQTRLAMALNRKLGLRAEVADGMVAEGMIYEAMGCREEARTHLQSAADYSLGEGIHARLSSIYTALARMQAEDGQAQEAARLYGLAQDWALREGQDRDLAFAQLGLAKSLAASGDPAAAYPIVRSILSDSVLLAQPEIATDAWSVMAEAAAARGRYREAFEAAEARDRLRVKQAEASAQTLLQARLDEQRGRLEQQALEARQTLEARQREELRRSRIQIAWMGGLAVLASGAGLWFLYRSWHHRRNSARIRRTNEDLRAQNQDRDLLFSLISHDFRAPLSSVQAGLSLISHEDLPPGQRKQLLSDLEAKVRHTSGLLDNLLYWAQTQRQGITPRMASVPLGQIAAQAEALLADQAQNKRIRLEISLPPEAAVWGDPDMLFVVVRNLLSNALKFTPEGGEVLLSAASTPAGWALQVRDTGIGITPAQVQALFEAKPLRSTRGTAREKGLGLGLSLCATFVRAMGGQIGVQSEPGAGSTFTVLLPAPEAAALPEAEDFAAAGQAA
ncbi:MAG: ATP-binding protein [Bacteroidia bacterium]|nr:ATP-binding protein [Bacteroidia bacterium]